MTSFVSWEIFLMDPFRNFLECMEDARELAPNSGMVVRLRDPTNLDPKATNP